MDRLERVLLDVLCGTVDIKSAPGAVAPRAYVCPENRGDLISEVVL